MERLSKQVIFALIILIFGCKKNSIYILPDEQCIIKKYGKIYQISLEITTNNNDSLILADYFTNKGDGNKFCLRSWKNNFKSGWSKPHDDLMYNNCKYVVKTSFQDDRAHSPLVFITDSNGNILLENR
jgi:hypothetical protein